MSQPINRDHHPMGSARGLTPMLLALLTVAACGGAVRAQDSLPDPPPPPASPSDPKGELERTFTGLSLAEARSQARTAGKSVLVYFSEDANAQCASYSEYTWSDEACRAWIAEHMIAVEVDLRAGAEAARRLGVSSAPTIVVISPTGKASQPIVGFRSASLLVPLLDARIVDPVKAARQALEKSADEPGARLALARALVDDGNYDDALREYLLLIDGGFGAQHGDIGPRLLAVRQIGPLLAAHPPVRAALVERREAMKKTILGGGATATEAALYAAINTQLGDVDDTIASYVRVREQAPDSVGARLLRDGLVDSLVATRRYEQAMTIIDPVKHFTFAFDVHKADERRNSDEKFRTFLRDGFVDRTIGYYEILLGAGRDAEAETIARELGELHPVAGTHDAIAEAAYRTGRANRVALDHAQRALALSGESPSAETLFVVVRAMKAADRAQEAAEVIRRFADKLGDPQQAEALRVELAAPVPAATGSP
jgi:tetratricopeptide (TPR) repeat protein